MALCFGPWWNPLMSVVVNSNMLITCKRNLMWQLIGDWKPNAEQNHTHNMYEYTNRSSINCCSGCVGTNCILLGAKYLSTWGQSTNNKIWTCELTWMNFTQMYQALSNNMQFLYACATSDVYKNLWGCINVTKAKPIMVYLFICMSGCNFHKLTLLEWEIFHCLWTKK